MKSRIVMAVAAVCTAAFGVGPLGDAATWFDETYQNFTEVRSNKWTTSAGTWRKTTADDKTVYTNASGSASLQLDTRGGEIQFTPSRTNVYNACVQVDADMTFTACRYGEEWDITSFSQHAAIAMRLKEDGETCTFIGWVSTRDGSKIKGRWLELSADGLTAEENRTYAVHIDSDYSCVPTRIRYTVDGHVLADSLGNTWFSTRSSLGPDVKQKKRATKIGLRGRGVLGRVTATEARPLDARAEVTFDALSRPQAGSTLTATVTAAEGVTLSGDLSYSWYLVDAAGMRVEGSLGTGSAYTLQSTDYGHWVAVDVSDAEGYAGTGRYWCSDLPVVEMTVGTADGYAKTDDETAETGVTYYYADEGDNFIALDIAEGADLAPYREQYEDLFVETIAYTWPSSKKETHSGTITIRGNAEYDDQVKNMAFTIHVRGNSTASQDKKPYKIKLDKKTDLFGLGGGVKNKHWVLLANSFDESLMRNKLSYDLSGQFGSPVWMKSEWVDVVMNGQYVGNYQLCQHIRVSDERIPILDWDSGDIAEKTLDANPLLTADDEAFLDEMLETNCLWMSTGEFSYLGTNYVLSAKKADGGTIDGQGRIKVYWKKWNGGDITQGLVFEIDSKKVAGGSSPAPSHFIQQNATSKGTLRLCVAMNTPEYAFTNPTISNYVWETWWDLGQAWMSGTGVNTKGTHYADIADFDSMVSYWLSQYVPGNDDAGSFSRYSYMDANGKMVFAPAWDFDYGLGSLQIRIRSAAVTNMYGEATYAPIAPEKWIPGNSGNNFMGHWTADPYFTFKLRERYLATRPYLTDMVKDGGLIDQYKVKLAASARANDLRWNNRIGFFGNAEEMGDADVLKEFLTRRFAWLDKQFATVGSSVSNVTKTVNASALRYTRTATVAPTFDNATATEGSVETDIADVTATIVRSPLTGSVAVPTSGATMLDVYVNGRWSSTVPVSSGSAALSIPAASLQSGGTNFIAFVAKNASGTELAKNVAVVVAALPDVVAEADGGHDVPIAWLADAWTDLAAAGSTAAQPVSYDDYLSFATNASPIGKSVPLWKDYVAGTEPTVLDDLFTANISMTNGTAYITWSPDRTALRAARVYTLQGASELSGPWASEDATNPSAEFRQTNRFFKVSVELAP